MSQSTPTGPADQSNSSWTDLSDPDVQRRKRSVDAKFGVGAWERASKQVNPHRCHLHMHDAIVSLQRMDWSSDTFRLFYECLRSKPGEEPARAPPERLPFTQHSEPTFSKRDPSS
ncbi:uncharacterized protein BJ171DRAFT_3865 [Polychytrium aggregatum]|uniref:uncharacterized protein n=1 Tax=Polychytrium aggregatum TaxID=110093 RepID=UPI0022FDF7FE|nr:uncharacterized protein BJ171DRAFT_3865 [Polychytrium aggregatum]KAI9209600.1 hypothetical protein BJ171DRAFT_3865 [Polychytrium aggregatum]